MPICSKFLITIFTLVLLLFSLNCSSAQKNSVPNATSPDQVARNAKGRKNDSVLKVVNSILQVASSNATQTLDDATKKTVYAEVEKISSANDLETFAMLCHAILSHQSASDIEYDMVFDAAFWRAAYLLSEDTSDEAVSSLEYLSRCTCSDAGYSLLFDEYMKRQKEKISKKN